MIESYFSYYYVLANICKLFIRLLHVETITPERALEIIAMNRKGQKPLSLDENAVKTDSRIENDILTDGDLSRFDKKKKKKKHHRPNRGPRPDNQ